MADIIPFGRRPTSGASEPTQGPWRLVSVRAEAPGFVVEVWTGRPSDNNTICALIGIRAAWPDAMTLAHDRARELSITEVFDWSGVVGDNDPEFAA